MQKKDSGEYDWYSTTIFLAHFRALPRPTAGVSWNRIVTSHMRKAKYRSFHYLKFFNQYQFIKSFHPQLKLFIYVNELESKQTKIVEVNAKNVMNTPSRTTESDYLNRLTLLSFL